MAKDYTAYAAGLLAAGMSKEDVDAEVERHLREDACLAKCVCPKCLSPNLHKKTDNRQAGPTSLPGSWVNYRCACGFMMDVVEDVPLPN